LSPELESGLAAQREVAEKLAEHFAERDDSRAMDLLDLLLQVQFGLIKILNQGWADALAKGKV
jgi:hypothetical protein